MHNSMQTLCVMKYRTDSDINLVDYSLMIIRHVYIKGEIFHIPGERNDRDFLSRKRQLSSFTDMLGGYHHVRIVYRNITRGQLHSQISATKVSINHKKRD